MKKVVCLLAVVLVLVGAESANSTTVVYLDDEELSKRAEKILTGECVGKKSYWNEEKNRIYTVYKFQITKTIKGEEVTRTFSFKQWGGELDGVRYHISGLATFSPQENAFMFLTPKTKRDFRFTVGLAQGKLKIVRNQQGKRYLIRNTMGLKFKKMKKSGRIEIIHDYDGYERRIREYVQKHEKKK